MNQPANAISLATPQPSQKKSWINLDSRYVAPAFITLILIVGHLSYGILESYWTTGLAIMTAIAVELILGRLIYGKWPHPARWATTARRPRRRAGSRMAPG